MAGPSGQPGARIDLPAIETAADLATARPRRRRRPSGALTPDEGRKIGALLADHRRTEGRHGNSGRPSPAELAAEAERWEQMARERASQPAAADVPAVEGDAPPPVVSPAAAEPAPREPPREKYWWETGRDTRDDVIMAWASRS